MWRDGPSLYSAVYTLTGAPKDVSRAEKIIPSKRWEAWREGVEDYTYLFMLRERIQAHRGEAGARTRAATAQRALDSAVANVLADANDPLRAETQREHVLRALASFQP